MLLPTAARHALLPRRPYSRVLTFARLHLSIRFGNKADPTAPSSDGRHRVSGSGISSCGAPTRINNMLDRHQSCQLRALFPQPPSAPTVEYSMLNFLPCENYKGVGRHKAQVSAAGTGTRYHFRNPRQKPEQCKRFHHPSLRERTCVQGVESQLRSQLVYPLLGADLVSRVEPGPL